MWSIFSCAHLHYEHVWKSVLVTDTQFYEYTKCTEVSLIFNNYLYFLDGRGFSLVVVRRGYFLIVVHWLLTVVASLVAEHRL